MEKLSKWIVLILSYTIFLYLTLLSLFTTAVAGKNHGMSEYIFCYKDYPFVHVLIVLGFISFLAFLYKKKWAIFDDSIEINLKKHFMVITVICLLLILATQSVPRGDQISILNPSSALGQGDFRAFYPTAYFDRYKNNKGIAFIFYLISFVTGGRNYLILQVLNIIAVLFSILLIYRIVRIYYLNDQPTLKLLLIFSYLFLPIFFYILFIYGNLYGLAMSLAAIKKRLDYRDTGKLRYIVLCAFYLALAYITKTNFIIIAIAVGIYFLIDISQRIRKSLFFLICFPLFIGGLSYGVTLGFTSITKLSEHNSQATLTWIKIGLSENNKRAPGWWDEGVDVEWNNGKRNPECLEQNIEFEVKERINKMWNDPKYALDFFSRKNAGTWANPEFESNLLLRGEKSLVSYSPLIKSLSLDEGVVHQVLLNFLNIMQTVLYLGVLLYLIFGGRKRRLEEMIFLVIFLGGFIFHLFWETKSQYAFVYVFMIIPYAARGYRLLIKQIDGDKKSKKETKTQLVIKALASLLVVICFGASLNRGSSINKVVEISKDTNLYKEYLADCKQISEFDQELILIYSKKQNRFLDSNKRDSILFPVKNKPESRYQLIEENGLFRIKRYESKYILRKGLEDNSVLEAELDYNDKLNQLWDFRKSDDGSYWIFIAGSPNYVLTLSDDNKTVAIKPIDETDENQKWYLLREDTGR